MSFNHYSLFLSLFSVTLVDFLIKANRCLCASVEYDFLNGFNSSEPKPGIHKFQLRSLKTHNFETIINLL
jgi:hypothetical protein